MPVGRIYSADFAGSKRYRWSNYIDYIAQPAGGIQLIGFIATLDEAIAAFKASF